MAEHALRQWARTNFTEAIGQPISARNAERAVYNWAVQTTRLKGQDSSWENSRFRKRYKDKAMCISQELKRGEAVKVTLNCSEQGVKLNIGTQPQLVYRIKHKQVESRDLATMDPDQLWPEGPYANAVFKIKEKELRFEKAKALFDEGYTGLLQCKKCKSNKTDYYTLQTRSADEPATVYASCKNCGNRWKFH